LSDGLRKVRLKFTSKSKGKRGDGRVIIQLAVSDTCLTFVYIYDKSDIENISEDFLDQIIIDITQGKYTMQTVESPET